MSLVVPHITGLNMEFHHGQKSLGETNQEVIFGSAHSIISHTFYAVIWNVVKPMIDEVTLKKIYILRGQQEIFTAMSERIPTQNIPPEYGGTSMPLGHSPQDNTLRQLMHHNNALAAREHSACAGLHGCQYCRFQIARSY